MSAASRNILRPPGTSGKNDDLQTTRSEFRGAPQLTDCRNILMPYLHRPTVGMDLNKMRLSTYIRGFDNWQSDLTNKYQLVKWVNTFKSLPFINHSFADEDPKSITKSAIAEVLEELKHLATLTDGPIEVGAVNKTWKSDSLIKTELKEQLLVNVAILESSVLNSQKDWNDRNEQVWNLLHPSMHCLVAKRSRILIRPHRPQPNRNDAERSNLLSFHPEVDFLPVPEGTKLAFDPQKFSTNGNWDDYTPSENYQWLPSEFQIGEDNSVRITSYINNLHPELHSGLYTVIEDVFHQFIPLFEKVLTYSLAGRTLQVITKLTNIELTPDKPNYPGGDFHSEGMTNEMIVASGIYYYLSENITESHLEFQVLTYGYMKTQKIGSVITKGNRCIAFPNQLEHRVTPFKLEDPDRNGSRKILAFFLVDPRVRVISTAHVPPQQKAWFVKEVLKGPVCFPKEIVEMIVDKMEWPMGWKEALKHRDTIKKERKERLLYFRGSRTTQLCGD